MFHRFINWVMANKLVVILLLLVFWLAARSSAPRPVFLNRSSQSSFSDGMAVSKMADVTSEMMPISMPEAPPVAGVNRLVIHNSNLSLLVKDVAQTITQIEQAAVTAGGYLVNSSLSLPEGAASGTIIIRVPEAKRQETLNLLKGLAVKTVSENVTGEDVTDEYVDIEARLNTLEKTKAKFESILDEAVKIQDILEIQRETISLQTQIDSLKGQQKYLEQSSQLAKITVYLSTDELALPYAPDQPWQPQAVFKAAVRTLLLQLQRLGSLIIWVTVFAVIWGPILLIILWYRRRQSKNQLPKE